MQHSFGLIIRRGLVASSDSPSVMVRLCANLPELGAWNIDRSPCLTVRSTQFQHSEQLLNEPCFYQLDIQLPSTIHEFDYKYVVNDKIWEGRSNENRKWIRNNEKNLADGVYYTPIDHWLDVETGCECFMHS